MVDGQINNSSAQCKPVTTGKDDLAASLGVNISTALRDLKRKGFAIDKVLTRSGQMTSVITKAEAERYCAERAAESLDGVEATLSLERQTAEIMDRATREIAALIKGA